MRILLVTSRFPWPARRGNQLRTTQMAEWLAQRHDVAVLAPRPLDQAGVPAGLPYEVRLHPVRWRARLASAGRALRRGWPMQSGLYDLSAVAAATRGRGREPDLVILQLARLQGALRGVGHLPMAIDFVDSLSLNFARRAARDRWWLRPVWLLESRLLAGSERQLLAHARLGWVVSERDRAAIAAHATPAGAARLRVLPVAVAPHGAAAARSAAPVVALTGNLGYFPTEEGATWLAKAVWPRLRRRFPAAELRVAGTRPSRRLRAAVAACGGRLLASPDDLAGTLREAAVAVAPLRCGSGVPIKILEAWAAGVPVVATPYAAAGTTGVPGEDFLTAETPADWEAALAAVLSEPALAARLAASGRARLRRDYDAGGLAGRLLADVEGALAD